MIIDHILSFLQYDLSNLFHKSCCCSDESIPTESPSTDSVNENCITNFYEPHPKIVSDGGWHSCHRINKTKAPEDEDLDQCDDTQMNDGVDERNELDCEEDDSSDDMECGERTSPQENQSCCQSLCKKIVEIVTSRFAGASVSELQGIEKRAHSLWNTLNTCARECGSSRSKYPNWWDLKSWQKLPFYWAALSNEILSEDPFENFKRFFLENKQRSKGHWSKQKDDRMLIKWRKICIKQRMPFIMEAFIAKVSVGKVNIHDDREIQRVIGELYNK